jgi:L-cysteine desulfidase
MNIKDKFFKYIGQKNKIETQLYQRSYKLILLKYLVELMDEEGRVRVTDIGEHFKNFYLHRKEKGLIHEVDADPSIKNIESSSLNRIILHIKDKPFKAIKDQGYMIIEMIQVNCTPCQGQNES